MSRAGDGAKERRRALAYFRGEIWPRRAALLSMRPGCVMVLIAGLTGLFADRLPLGELRVSDLALAGLSFAALSFGACVMGSVLSLTIPDTEQLRKWASTFQRKGPAGSNHNVYSNLVFVFTWSAMAQLAVVTISVLGFIFGGNQMAAPHDGWEINRLWIALSIFTFIYALDQLAVVIRTISQVGRSLILGWQVAPAATGAAPSDPSQEVAVDGGQR